MYFGWYVVAGTFVAQLFVAGFFTYSVSLVVPFVREDFGVELTDVMYGLTFGTLLGLVTMPVVGAMLDRYNIRWIMAAGTAFFAAGLWLLGNVNSITQFVLVFGLAMSLANALGSSVASQTAISRWFTASRGKALGISAIGTSIGGMIVPALVAWWLREDGWRVAMENLGILVALVSLPIVVLTIRGKPEDIGLQAEASPQAHAAGDAVNLNLGMQDILRHRGFWLIGLALGILFAVYSAILANLTQYAVDLGATAREASRLIMVLAITGLVGKLLFGFAADRINLKFGLWVAMFLVCTSFLLLASEPAFALVYVAAMMLGLATGGMLPTWGAMMASVFGLVSYGRAMGLMGPLITLVIMPSFAVVGWLYDATGGFQSCLLLFSGLVILAALLLVPLKLHAGQPASA